MKLYNNTISTKMLSYSTVTLYEDKSLRCVPNAISFPVLQYHFYYYAVIHFNTLDEATKFL